jgi:hypothetical protein
MCVALGCSGQFKVADEVLPLKVVVTSLDLVVSPLAVVAVITQNSAPAANVPPVADGMIVRPDGTVRLATVMPVDATQLVVRMLSPVGIHCVQSNR